jgi:hypothetical protein
MKKLIVFIGFGLFALAGNGYAQTCNHGAKSAEAKTCVKPSEAALKAASLDPTIETKTCKDGSVCFIRTTKDAQGVASTTQLMYDEAKAEFVSMPEGGMGGAGNGKACSASKACCAKGAASGKACCKAKGTAAVTAPENAAPEQPAQSN